MNHLLDFREVLLEEIHDSGKITVIQFWNQEAVLMTLGRL